MALERMAPSLLALVSTTNSTTGVITKGGNKFIHDFTPSGSNGGNTFIGVNAGNFTMAYSSSAVDASYNTAVGQQALTSLTTGPYNTAVGYQALFSASSPYSNTAVGAFT
ncbi:MAG: hypothetical protein WCH40_11425, partial [Verrucomicrobiales bacterium]